MASSPSSHKRSFSDFQRETPAASRKLFDAFINHRGPDVKDTLAFALYDAIEEKRCWAFLDDMELQLGDSIDSAIQDAIYSSRVQIAIFSPRYAESPWCLNELLLMLETKALFIPIFCDVKPFEVRFPDKGVYAAAFAKHEEQKRFSKEKIDQWKAALHTSSHISGYEFTSSNDNVETLRTKIALAVQKKVGKLSVFQTRGEVGLHSDGAASTSTSALVKKSSLLPRDSHPVGLQTKVDDIKGLLQDPQVPVVAVVGMGGSGKTFLLQNVYKDAKTEYEHSIWLSVSKSYSIKNLQYDIAYAIGLTKKIVKAKVSEETAAEIIENHLKGKRCLIVLDDLWELSTENSLFDKLGLPAHQDCKIVITSRDRQVALICGAKIYEMENLSDEDSWRLFCLYAFPNEIASPQLKEEGQRIVKQCGNLPLAIKTMAASLANSTLRKWKSKRLQLEKIATPIADLDHLAVMKILKLSYDSLPAYLKPCFAYLSFFSEDEEINAEYLIQLWLAEGLIPAGEDQWDMAWDWLDRLAELCLLQVHEISALDLVSNRYFYKVCKIHDLLYDLAIQFSKEDNCLFSVEELSSHTSGAPGWHRILLAKKDLDSSAMSEIRPVMYLRTLSLSGNRKIISIPENLFTTMRGLRVLDLNYTGISTLPSSLGRMILLRVLNLRGTEIIDVPECVKHLKSLVFLALPEIEELPEWISGLQYLQHLEFFSVDRVSKGIAKLRYLRTLRSEWGLSIEEDGLLRLDDFVTMTQLQEVNLCLNHEMDLKRTEDGILAQLVDMRHLHLSTKVKNAGKFSEKMRAMEHLEYLWLDRFVIPGWICELQNLRELNLWNSEMQRLPREFGKSGAFPQLRRLSIISCRSLEEFPEVEEGAMPSLQMFSLHNCPKLEKLEGLERLTTVKKFIIPGQFHCRIAKIKALNPCVEFGLSQIR